MRLVLVHRPRYDDWSFPKGKQRRGETLLAAALREVREETGFLCVAEASIGVTEYIDRGERPKLVRYWVMKRVNGASCPTTRWTPSPGCGRRRPSCASATTTIASC